MASNPITSATDFGASFEMPYSVGRAAVACMHAAKQRGVVVLTDDANTTKGSLTWRVPA